MQRKTEHNINNIFTKRWSPRSLTGEVIKEEEFLSIIEAARWAPSSFNEQPWKFLYATRNSKNWDKFFELLVEANQQWVKNASHLVLIISKKTFTKNGNDNVVHMFDAGSAWENAALQASELNIVAHGIAGFDYNKAREELNIPDDYAVCAMFTLGYQDSKDKLPENFQANEEPSNRKSISEILIEGKFN